MLVDCNTNSPSKGGGFSQAIDLLKVIYKMQRIIVIINLIVGFQQQAELPHHEHVMLFFDMLVNVSAGTCRNVQGHPNSRVSATSTCDLTWMSCRICSDMCVGWLSILDLFDILRTGHYSIGNESRD